MAEAFVIEIPEIADAAVGWACSVLGLPATAFHGHDGLNARLPVLRLAESADIEACPGSGKTTLLVAKLAILANQWTDLRRGLCVLSHTNVARHEIERRLGSTAAGQQLLAFPHFIGTIHGFVNEFLAIPWLRSKGFPIEMIDDDIVLARRWQKLDHATRSGLERNRHNENRLKIRNTALDLGEFSWGKNKLGRDAPTYKAMQATCQDSMNEGFFCYDEMFVWANDLLDQVPEVATFLRARFPLLFLDEVQDNSEPQSTLLHRIFIDGEHPVIRQRFGDQNQAIYNSTDQYDGVRTDAFPLHTARKDIPNSFRFAQDIADLADPLAVDPQSLIGLRNQKDDDPEDTAGKHAIFLFDDKTIGLVLSSYAGYLAEIFSRDKLKRGTFAAVGAVHRPGENDNLPRSVGDYWPEYDHEISRADPQPGTFVQYIRAGYRLSFQSGETHHAVERIAEAVLRLGRIAGPEFRPGTRTRRHRHVLELLSENEKARSEYLSMIDALAIEHAELNEENWNGKWTTVIKGIVKALIKTDVEGRAAERFLQWTDFAGDGNGGKGQAQRDNVFRSPEDNPTVAIRVGSIHSVKGETHTATLVLETFYRTHHLKALKPWLIGKKSGGATESPALQSRLRQHYVAMTRPSHLLCLAMREDSFTDKEIDKLKERGWRLARVLNEGAEWL